MRFNLPLRGSTRGRQGVDDTQCFKSREDNYVPTVQYQKILIYFVCVTTSYNQKKQHESPSSEVDQAKSPYDLERRMQLQRNVCAL